MCPYTVEISEALVSLTFGAASSVLDALYDGHVDEHCAQFQAEMAVSLP